MSFREMLEGYERAVRAGYAALDNARKAMNQAQSVIRQNEYELARLKEIACMSSSGNAWVWRTEGRESGGDWSDYNRRELWTYSMYGGTFTVLLQERKDLKLWKHEVKVYCHGSIYDNYYFKNRYGEKGIAEKFKSEADALSFIDQWKTRLINDHAGEIAEQCGIASLSREEGLNLAYAG